MLPGGSTPQESRGYLSMHVDQKEMHPIEGNAEGKRERRLHMNRLSARLRRRRHQDVLTELQRSVNDLEHCNKRIRAENEYLQRLLKVAERNQTGGESAALPPAVAESLPAERPNQHARNTIANPEGYYENLVKKALEQYAQSANPNGRFSEVNSNMSSESSLDDQVAAAGILALGGSGSAPPVSLPSRIVSQTQSPTPGGSVADEGSH